MNLRLLELRVTTRRTVETFLFSQQVTFLYGPLGAGKSSVARLIDYCLGGRLERTPAIQLEFVGARLRLEIGSSVVQLERTATDTGVVRVSWVAANGEENSLNAPLDAGPSPIHADNVWNLSDLIFALAKVEPIRVRKSKRDPQSQLVRLSFRDLLWYCYLKQDKLDGSFFRLEDTFKKYKSMDVMRFVTGLYSERLSELESKLVAAQDAQRSKRDAVIQFRTLLEQMSFGSDLELAAKIDKTRTELKAAIEARETLDKEHSVTTHVLEPLRQELRLLTQQIGDEEQVLFDLKQRIQDQVSVRSELITSKLKAERSDIASSLLGRVKYVRCPCCGGALAPERFSNPNACELCGTDKATLEPEVARTEAFEQTLNLRIDELSDSINRHKRAYGRQERGLSEVRALKVAKDAELDTEMRRYDSAFVASARAADRRVAMLQERVASLRRMAKLPEAVTALEQEAGELQGQIDAFRSAVDEERRRLRTADNNIRALEDRFLQVMLRVGFPGVDASDRVEIDPRNWEPRVVHGDNREVVWGFFEAGSGGKKTLFNVCYALALHEVASEHNLHLPNFLIIDSPSKNFGREVNRPLATAMFQYAYALSLSHNIQLLVIDPDFVPAVDSQIMMIERLMKSGDREHPPLISYYQGP